jgi:hypothetical protein
MDILTFEASSVGISLSTATDVQQLTIKHEETTSSITWRTDFSNDSTLLPAYLRSTYVLDAYIGPPHRFLCARCACISSKTATICIFHHSHLILCLYNSKFSRLLVSCLALSAVLARNALLSSLLQSSYFAQKL